MSDMWVVWGVLLVAVVLAVPVLLAVALLSISALKRRVAALESALAQRSEEPAVSAPTQRPYAWAEPAPEAEDIGLRAEPFVPEPVAEPELVPEPAPEPAATRAAPPPLPEAAPRPGASRA